MLKTLLISGWQVQLKVGTRHIFYKKKQIIVWNLIKMSISVNVDKKIYTPATINTSNWCCAKSLMHFYSTKWNKNNYASL